MVISTGYEFINAKVHGMRSQVYEAERLAALLNCAHLSELLQTLHPQRGKVFTSDTTVERFLAEEYFRALQEICQYMPRGAALLFDALLSRRSVENMKVVIQFWQSEKRGAPPPGRLEDLLVEDPYLALPPMADLLRLETLPELLEDMPLHIVSDDFLRRAAWAIEQVEKNKSLFYLMLAMDAAYYTRLWGCMNTLSAGDRAIAVRIVGAEVDMANLFAALRLRSNYRLTGDETRALLIPYGSLVSERVLGSLCEAEEADAALAALPLTYRRLCAGARGDVSQMESAFWDHIYRIANRVFYQSSFDIGVALGFYIVKKIEMINLSRVIQGYRYEAPKNEIEAALIPLRERASH